MPNTKRRNCSVKGCKWDSYVDTGKCYAHSKGETPSRQPTILEKVRMPDSKYLTFAEVSAREGRAA